MTSPYFWIYQVSRGSDSGDGSKFSTHILFRILAAIVTGSRLFELNTLRNKPDDRTDENEREREREKKGRKIKKWALVSSF